MNPGLSLERPCEALAAVVRGLNDASLEVRREAVAALGDVAPYGDLQGTALLCECSVDPDPTVRCALAHASAIIAPWGHGAMTSALLQLLADSHVEVRVRALDALAAVARPSDEAVALAVKACREDAQERVQLAAERALALLAAPELAQAAVGRRGRAKQVVLPTPEPIEGLKSQKAALLRLEKHATWPTWQLYQGATHRPRASRIDLSKPRFHAQSHESLALRNYLLRCPRL